MNLNEEECIAAGLDPAAVKRLARRLEKAAKDATKLGLMVFGGAGSGSLRTLEVDDKHRSLIVAFMEGSWSGGDGAEKVDENGLICGEGAH